MQESDFCSYTKEMSKIINNIVNIGIESCSIPNILLASARNLYNFSKSLLSFKSLKENETVVKSMLSQMNSYALAFFEHHMDSVRHLCKDIFKNVVVLAKILDFNKLLQDILKSCKEEFALSISSVVLLQMSQALGTTYILENMEGIFEKYFDKNLGSDLHVNNFFEGLMLTHHKEVDISNWQDLWIAYLLNSANSSTNQRLAEIENLVSKAVKCEPQVLNFICEYKLSKISISTKLAALSSAKKSSNIQPFSADFREAILSSSDDTKILALKLLIESRKTTEIPATRQKSLALLEKSLTRLSLNIEKLQKTKVFDLESNQFYLKFLQDFTEILTGNLDDGSNFSRRSISLNLLEKCVEIFKNFHLPLEKLLAEKLENALFSRLEDSYEKNVHKLIVSVKPTDSLTAAYQCEYICESSESSYLEILNWVKNILMDGLVIAKKSISLASRDNPLYGALVVIKHLLDKLDLNKITDNSWKAFINEMIGLSKELTRVVGPIVNNSSPEGHLPNDFSPLDLGDDENKEYLESLNTKRQKTHNVKITPQMVLICAWRTVKEVSLILGNIVLYSPLSILITKDQVIEIGEHFKELLSETKHRGAFEQAYVGFSKLCTRLWRESELHQLPMIWLTNLMEEISKDENVSSKMCATRRSAGVPFLVQALITSELQVGTTKALNYCMNTLISICYDSSKSTESRVHALNILRALFRCTDLNEAVSSFITDGMICSIEGYDANTWAERNSSTLTYILPAYPRLYDFILAQLEEASKGVYEENFGGLTQISTRKLHPLLLLLSRLYPSALEGTESNLKLSDFIPYISICSSCKELQTRILAAKAISAIISKDHVEEYLSSICSVISSEFSLPTNFVHGQILQILHLIRGNQISREIEKEIFESLIKVQKEIDNAVILTCIFDIFNEILRKTLSGSNTIPLDKIKSDYQQKESFYYPVLRKSLMIFKIHKLRLENNFEVIGNVLCNFENASYEEIETKLNIILLTMTECPDEQFEIRNDEISCVKILEEKPSLNVENLLDQVLSSNIFYPECAIKAYAFVFSTDWTSKTPLAMCVEKYTRTNNKFETFLKCIEFLKDVSQPWNTDCLRFRAACILENICSNFIIAVNLRNWEALIDSTLILLNLLQDDELYVRQQAALVVLKCTGKSEDCDVLPLYAAEIFISWLAMQLKVLNSNEDIQRVFQEIVNIHGSNECVRGNDCDDIEIFDKNEANVFAEPRVIVDLVTKVFRDQFDFIK
uniref:tRNA (32-2'-O)-methyltransferase regulator THADA n=1 Tax=Megaselia scalaris TaxID=36166 RepID=T1GE42_MEGSC